MVYIHRFAGALLLFAVGLVWASAACGSEPLDLKSALAKRISVEFSRASLQEALAELSRLGGVPILIDRQALKASGITLNGALPAQSLREASLNEALDQLLRPQQLEWIERHGVVLVTTARAAEEEYFEARVYRLTRDVPAERRLRSILWNVAPQSWATTGGQGDAAALPPRLLVVRQTPARHRQLARTFAQSVEPVRAGREDGSPQSETSKRLAAPVTIDLKNARLKEAIERLADQSGLAIKFDQQTAAETRLDFDSLHFTVQEAALPSVASALSLILEAASSDLEWMLEGDTITITTAEAAAAKMIPADYSVKDMLPEGGSTQLIEAIQYTVAPQTWEYIGGDGSLTFEEERGVLKVVQSDPVHRQLRQLFADLRAGLRAHSASK